MAAAGAILRFLKETQAPAEEAVDVKVGYASRIYRRMPEHLDGQVAAIMAAAPPNQPRIIRC